MCTSVGLNRKPSYKTWGFLNLSLFSKSAVICFNSSSNVNHPPVASLWTSLMWSHVKSSITPESSERDYLYSCRLFLSPSTKMKRRSSTVWFWSLSSEENFFAGGQRAVSPDLISQNSPPWDIHICLLKKNTHSLLLPLLSWRFLRPYSLKKVKIQSPVIITSSLASFWTEETFQRVLLSWGFVWRGFHLGREQRKKRRTTNISFIAQKRKNSYDMLLHIILQHTIYY